MDARWVGVWNGFEVVVFVSGVLGLKDETAREYGHAHTRPRVR